MVASVSIPTLSTVLLVEDDNLPDTIFVVKSSDAKPAISQYVRLGALPKDLEEAVRKVVWND